MIDREVQKSTLPFCAVLCIRLRYRFEQLPSFIVKQHPKTVNAERGAEREDEEIKNGQTDGRQTRPEQAAAKRGTYPDVGSPPTRELRWQQPRVPSQ